MKPTHWIIAIGSAALLGLTAGCSKESETTPAAEVVRETPPQSEVAQKVNQEAGKAVQNLENQADRLKAQKAEFVSRLRQELAELNKQIDQFAERAAQASEPIKAESEVKAQELRTKVIRLGEQLDQVPATAESAWEEAKVALAKAYDETKNSINNAREWLADKIRP